MIAYASHTGTKRNLEALRVADWRLMIAPVHRRAPTHGFRYALDNGAWHAHQAGKPWDRSAFYDLVIRRGADADFIVAPDVVGDGRESLARSIDHWNGLRELGTMILFAVQEGTPDSIRDWLSPKIGIFVGGATAEWKEKTMATWAALARSKGAYCHVGRVNTGRRIKLCAMAGVDSFDGTSATRYAKNTGRLNRHRQQMIIGAMGDP